VARKKIPKGVPGQVSFHLEYRKCRPGKCATCDAGGRHGPYWYAVFRDGERICKRYCGLQPWLPGLRRLASGT
jgi:hypothetical protein